MWHRSVVVLAGLTSLFAAVSVPAQDEPFPGYSEACGYPMIYAPTASVSQAVLSPSDQEIIVLDPLLAEPGEAERRQFLIAHECAHHRMQHAGIASRRARARSAEIIRDQELSADCWAAETLARQGMDRTVQIMADRFFKSGLYSPGGGYPAGIQRSTIVMHCAERGRTTRLQHEKDKAN